MAGLSIGREGPSVQIAAGIMQHAKVMLGPKTGITRHALLVAGGSAGIAAAFHAPLAGVVFAIEELSRKMDSRNSDHCRHRAGRLDGRVHLRQPHLFWPHPGTAPGLGGLHPRPDPGWPWPAACWVACSRASWWLRSPARTDCFSALRTRFPVRFAAAGGLRSPSLAVTGGATYGAGSEAVKHMLAGNADVPEFYVTLKFIATWLTAWCGVPGAFLRLRCPLVPALAITWLLSPAAQKCRPP